MFVTKASHEDGGHRLWFDQQENRLRQVYYPRYASMNAFLAFNADMWWNRSGAELYSGPMAGCGHRTYDIAVAVLEGHKISVRSNIVLIMNGVQDQ